MTCKNCNTKEESLKKEIKRLQEENLRLRRKIYEDSWRGEVDCMSGAFRQDEIDNVTQWR